MIVPFVRLLHLGVKKENHPTNVKHQGIMNMSKTMPHQLRVHYISHSQWQVRAVFVIKLTQQLSNLNRQQGALEVFAQG